ncbi:hypothetical protein ACSSS7_001493 [Eimeria intestinalis]
MFGEEPLRASDLDVVGNFDDSTSPPMKKLFQQLADRAAANILRAKGQQKHYADEKRREASFEKEERLGSGDFFVVVCGALPRSVVIALVLNETVPCGNPVFMAEGCRRAYGRISLAFLTGSRGMDPTALPVAVPLRFVTSDGPGARATAYYLGKIVQYVEHRGYLMFSSLREAAWKCQVFKPSALEPRFLKVAVLAGLANSRVKGHARARGAPYAVGARLSCVKDLGTPGRLAGIRL